MTDEIATIEQAMVRLRRSQSRRSLARLARRRNPRSGPPTAVFELLDAIEGGARTVTEVANALDIDQPRASRLAADALDSGLVRRSADRSDGRRSLLALTAAGRRTVERVHAFRQQIVLEATSDWTSRDRVALARLLDRFVDDLARVAESDGR